MSTEADPLATAQQLGESYAALLGQREWQVDEIPVAEPESTATPSNDPPSQPPLAEPVNEPTVPPTPLQIIEAMLFVGGPPLTFEDAADAIRGLTPEQFRECIDVLNRVYRGQNRPYSVVHGAAGHVLHIGARYAAVRERLFGGPREARLTQPALDVLSLVAYRQPVPKSEIDAVRGSDSGAVLRQLLRLGLIAVTESNQESKETHYGTSKRFLEVFRLRDLDDLPQLGEPERVA
jgi:chromosome segregation and condensation protein ScpB